MHVSNSIITTRAKECSPHKLLPSAEHATRPTPCGLLHELRRTSLLAQRHIFSTAKLLLANSHLMGRACYDLKRTPVPVLSKYRPHVLHDYSFYCPLYPAFNCTDVTHQCPEPPSGQATTTRTTTQQLVLRLPSPRLPTGNASQSHNKYAHPSPNYLTPGNPWSRIHESNSTCPPCEQLRSDDIRKPSCASHLRMQ